MKIHPWQFEFAVVIERPGTGQPRKLLQIKQLNRPDTYHLDTSGTFGPEPLEKAKKFISSLGYRFPLPIGAEAAHAILSFKGFPKYEVWAKFVDDNAYTEKMYFFDLNLWTKNSLHPKSFQDLSTWLARAVAKARSRPALQDRAAYARMVLDRFEQEKGELETFFDPQKLTPPTELLMALKALGSSYIPKSKRDEKKLARSAASGTEAPVVPPKSPRGKKKNNQTDSLDTQRTLL